MTLDDVGHDAVMGRIRVGLMDIEFCASIAWKSRCIELRGLHVYGAGPNTYGIRILRASMQQVMILLDVDEVLIIGAERVSGAANGDSGTGPRMPKQLLFRREPS